MNDTGGDRAGGRAGALAFFGVVTASVSHELNNVLSIVDQTGGLLQDTIAAGAPIQADRVAAAAGAVRRQAERGLEIVRRLNRFAHSADDVCVRFDPTEVLENLVGLSQRFAQLERVELDLADTRGHPTLTGDPLAFQAVTFHAIRSGLAAARRGDRVTVGMREGDDGARFVLECPSPIEVGDEVLENLRRLATHLRAGVSTTDGNGTSTLEITFRNESPRDAAG